MPFDQFSKFRNLYKEPERLTPDEARQRRLFSALAQARKELEDRETRLSQANQFHLNKLKEFEAKFSAELETKRRSVERMNLRDPSILRSAANRSTISRLFQLQQRRNALLQRAEAERRANRFQKSFVDRRQFSFGQFKFRPMTMYGTDAWITQKVNQFGRKQFRHATFALPCIERSVRREVLFAKGHGGKGHRTRKRRGPLSHIGC